MSPLHLWHVTKATSGLGIREAVQTEHLIQAVAVTLDTSPRSTIDQLDTSETGPYYTMRLLGADIKANANEMYIQRKQLYLYYTLLFYQY